MAIIMTFVVILIHLGYPLELALGAAAVVTGTVGYRAAQSIPGSRRAEFPGSSAA